MSLDVYRKQFGGIGITIRELQTEDSFEEITELLHNAYRPLSEMGLRFVATYQDVKTTRDRCKEGYTLLAKDDSGKIVSTITLYPPKSDSISLYYRRENVWKFGQFAVLPELQKTGIGSYIMYVVEQYAKSMNGSELALDTSEKAVHLIEYYTKRGYEFREFVQWEVTNYRSIVLSKVLD